MLCLQHEGVEVLDGVEPPAKRARPMKQAQMLLSNLLVNGGSWRSIMGEKQETGSSSSADRRRLAGEDKRAGSNRYSSMMKMSPS
jgi:hypothetical protein